MSSFTTMHWLFTLQLPSWLLLFVVLLCAAAALIIFFVVKKMRAHYRLSQSNTKLVFYLAQFNRLFSANTVQAEQWLLQLKQKVQNAIEHISVSQADADAIQELNYNKLVARLDPWVKAGPAGNKVTVFLAGMLQQLRYSCSNFQKVQQHIAAAHKRLLGSYYYHALELSKLHDELKDYVKGKSLNPDSAAWVKGYFEIFEHWLGNGGDKEPSVVQQQLIEKISSLNSFYPDTAFVNRTSAQVIKCREICYTLQELHDEMTKEVNNYASTTRMAARVTRIVRRAVEATMNAAAAGTVSSEIISVAAPVKRILRTAATVLLLVTAMGFMYGWGAGWYHNNSQATDSPPAANNRGTMAKSFKKQPLPDTGAKKVLPPQPLYFALDTLKRIVGLDISHYQGNLLKDYAKLDTLHFVICKATQGISDIDPDFSFNWEELRKVNIIRGAYHFYSTSHDPLQQARHFIKTVGQLHITDIPLVLDIEAGSMTGNVSTSLLQKQLLLFLDYVEKQTGKKPIVYTSYSFADSYLNKADFARYPLWLAEYTSRQIPKVPSAWKKNGHTIWQKTDNFTIDSRKTDYDIFNGNGKTFRQFILQGR